MLQGRKRNRKWIWIGVGVLLVVLAVVGVIVWQNNGNGNDSKNNGGGDGSVGVKVQDGAENNEVAEGDKFAEEEIAKKKVKQYEGTDPNESAELTGVMTYSGVVDGMLMMRISIDQYVGAGTCDLALLRGGETVYKSVANVRADAATSTCEGFDVPVSELGPGNLQIVININADGKMGVIRGEAEV